MARNPRGAAAPQPAASAPAAQAVIETAAEPPADEQPAAPAVIDAPEPPVDAAPAPAAPAPVADEPIPDLDDYIAGHERAAQAVDLVVTAISHPAAKPRHHQGVYSGFPVDRGPLSATYSDGSTH